MKASAEYPSPEVKRRIIFTKPTNSAWIQFGSPAPNKQEPTLRSSAVMDRASPRETPQPSSLTQSMLIKNGNFKIINLTELPNKSLAVYRSLSASRKRQEGTQQIESQKNVSQFDLKYSFLQGSQMQSMRFMKVEKGVAGIKIL